MPQTPSYIVTLEKDYTITLPHELVRLADLKEGDAVNIEYTDGVITLEKVGVNTPEKKH